MNLTADDLKLLMKYRELLAMIIKEIRFQTTTMENIPIEQLLTIGLRDTITAYKDKKYEESKGHAIKTGISLLLLANQLRKKIEDEKKR